MLSSVWLKLKLLAIAVSQESTLTEIRNSISGCATEAQRMGQVLNNALSQSDCDTERKKTTNRTRQD